MILRVHAVHTHVQAAPRLADHLRRDRHLTAGIQHILRLRAPKNHGFPEGIPRGIRVLDSHHRTHDSSGNRLQANRLAPAPADPYFCYFHFIILSAGRMIHPASLCAKAWNVAYRVGIRPCNFVILEKENPPRLHGVKPGRVQYEMILRYRWSPRKNTAMVPGPEWEPITAPV